MPSFKPCLPEPPPGALCSVIPPEWPRNPGEADRWGWASLLSPPSLGPVPCWVCSRHLAGHIPAWAAGGTSCFLSPKTGWAKHEADECGLFLQTRLREHQGVGGGGHDPAWQSAFLSGLALSLPLWFGTLAFLGVYFSTNSVYGCKWRVPASRMEEGGAALEQS